MPLFPDVRQLIEVAIPFCLGNPIFRVQTLINSEKTKILPGLEGTTTWPFVAMCATTARGPSEATAMRIGKLEEKPSPLNARLDLFSTRMT